MMLPPLLEIAKDAQENGRIWHRHVTDAYVRGLQAQSDGERLGWFCATIKYQCEANFWYGVARHIMEHLK